MTVLREARCLSAFAADTRGSSPEPLLETRIFYDRAGWRRRWDRIFFLAVLVATVLAVSLLIYLIGTVLVAGLPALRVDFFLSFPSRYASKAGFRAAIFGSLWLAMVAFVSSVLSGVGGALYLQELAPKGRLSALIELSIATLAGIPSVIFGMLGLAVFVRFLALGRSVLAGGLTLGLLIMPTIIIATREALKAVPDGVRLSAIALGATRWQAMRDHVLPAALPGIATGVILAMARSVGEAAPLILLGAFTYVAFVPESCLDAFTAMPIQIYNWTSRPQAEFHNLAAAGIVVLLGLLLLCNAAAISLRLKWERQRR